MPRGAATRARHTHPPPALALVPCPKQCHLWATIVHRGARGTLDEFKATWEGCLTHHGDTPKILQGNLAPAAIAHWRISLEPYTPSRRNWLVCNLAYRIEWHCVLHKMHAGPARLSSTPLAPLPRARLTYTRSTPSRLARVWNVVACPETTCSTRPTRCFAATSVSARNCTTKVRWGKQ